MSEEFPNDGSGDAGREWVPAFQQVVLDYAPARAPTSRRARLISGGGLLAAAVPGLATVAYGLYVIWYALTEGPALDRGADAFAGAVITAIGAALTMFAMPWFWHALRRLRPNRLP